MSRAESFRSQSFTVGAVGDLRKVIECFADECKISAAGARVELTYRIKDGEGELIVRPEEAKAR